MTRGDVLNYINGLKTQLSHRFLTGQLTAWLGSGAPDVDIPPLLDATGKVPAMVAMMIGELGFAEDAAHYFAGDNPDAATELPNAIADMISYCEAGSLARINYLPASMVGPTTAPGFITAMNTNTFGRRDPTVPITYPLIVADLIAGVPTCAQWRVGSLVTGLTYAQVLDYHANYIKQIHDTGAVIILSPFNEFDVALKGQTDRSWWNMTGADFIALWRFVHDYFTITKGLTNIIWLWNLLDGESAGPGQRDGMSYYPGNNYVDLVGWSHYVNSATVVEPPVYSALQATGKTIMLGEIGLQTDPSHPPKDLDVFFESMKLNMPLVSGGMFWADFWAMWHQTNLVNAMNNLWVVNSPIVLETPPVADFDHEQIAGTHIMKFTDTSV